MSPAHSPEHLTVVSWNVDGWHTIRDEQVALIDAFGAELLLDQEVTPASADVLRRAGWELVTALELLPENHVERSGRRPRFSCAGAVRGGLRIRATAFLKDAPSPSHIRPSGHLRLDQILQRVLLDRGQHIIQLLHPIAGGKHVLADSASFVRAVVGLLSSAGETLPRFPRWLALCRRPLRRPTTWRDSGEIVVRAGGRIGLRMAFPVSIRGMLYGDRQNAKTKAGLMEITPTATTLRGLLGYEKKLTIPTFQRGYEWEKDQVEAFWEAVVNTAAGESIFFGPMVTLTRQDASGEIQVVDGQQRLTTVFLTLALLRNWVRKQESLLIYKGDENQQNVDTMVRKEIFFLDDDDVPNPSQQRFAAAERIRAVFRDSVLADNPKRPLSPRGAKMSPREKEETKDLRRANTILKSLIAEHLEGTPKKPSPYFDHNAKMRAVLKLKAALLDNFEIFTLNLVSEDDAYILFESLNNRGLRLSPGDILRTISLGGVRKEYPKDETHLEAAVERWKNIAESLGEYDLSSFLRHYLLATTNERVQKKKVVSVFRVQIEKSSPSREIHALESAAAYYQLILPPHMHASLPLDNESMQLSSAGLNLLNETHRLVMLGVLLADSEPKGDRRKEQARFLRAIESLTFRWLLKGGNAQELETLYQSILYKMGGAGSAAHVPLDYLVGAEQAAKSAPSDPDIRGFPRSERIANLRYVLFRIEASRSGELPAAWLKPTVTLEHLAPQTATAFWNERVGGGAVGQTPDEETEAYEDIVQKWGNLALLEERLNKSVKNKNWDDKVAGVGKYPGLRGTQFKGTLDVAEQSDWNQRLIEHRTEWLADLGLALVSSDWVETGCGPSKTDLVWSPPN